MKVTINVSEATITPSRFRVPKMLQLRKVDNVIKAILMKLLRMRMVASKTLGFLSNFTIFLSDG